LQLSKDKISDDKYLESFIPQLYEPFTFKIKCDGYYFIRNYSPQLPKDIKCKDIKQPLFKEQCNSIKNINPEFQCCYMETKYDSKIEKECVLFNPETLKLEEDYKNYMKYDIIFSIYGKNISNYDSIIKEFSSRIPISQEIKCNTYAKTIDYSKTKLTKNDFILSQKNNFCPYIDADTDFTKCLNGLLFSDFIRGGGQCCYFEIKLGKNTVYKQCIPLSKYSRENYYFIESIIEEFNPSGNYFVKVICNGFESQFDSSEGKWTKISKY
jgi:DNA-binding Lrp family transcriptional regulator